MEETEPDGQTEVLVTSEESFQRTYFPEAFAKRERERGSGATIGDELAHECVVLIRSALTSVQLRFGPPDN